MSTGKRLALLVNISLLIMIRNIGFCGDYSTVTNLWWNGYKTNVLAIAESRLEANTNDIVGIMLKLEYYFSFTYRDDFTNNIPKAIEVAAKVHTPNFSAVFDDFVETMTELETFIRENPLSESDLQRERAKGSIAHKRMNFRCYLKALDDDGFFEGTPNEDE